MWKNFFKREISMFNVLSGIYKATLHGNPFERNLLDKQEIGNKVRFELSCESHEVEYLEKMLTTFKVTNEYKNLKVVECVMSKQEYDKKFKGKSFARFQESAKQVYEHFKKLDKKEKKAFSNLYHPTLLTVYTYASQGVFNIKPEQVEICIEILDSVFDLVHTDIVANSNALMEELIVIRNLRKSVQQGTEDDQDWALRLKEKLERMEE